MATNHTASMPLQKFKDAFADGTRAHEFIVDFSPLVTLFPELATELENTKYLVRSASKPERSVTTNMVHFMGMPTEYSGRLEHKDWTVTFINNISNTANKLIETWMAVQHNPVTNTRGNSQAYKEGKQIIFDQIDGNGNVIERYTLLNIFPKAKGEQTADYESGDFQSFTVTFSYDYYTPQFSNFT